MSPPDRAPSLSDRNSTTEPGREDFARAEAQVPVNPESLFQFIADVERLVRLNPHLEIETWLPVVDGVRLVALNETNSCRIETAVGIETDPVSRSIVLRYADGLKRLTTIAAGDGDRRSCRLIVTEHYPFIADAGDPRVAEVDRSLVPWVGAVRRHLVGRARWGWLPGWHWWHERILPGMAPRQRRIVRMIVWIGALEFIVFLFVAAIFWLERHGS